MGRTNENALHLEEFPLAELRPYERNARTHSPEQVRQIARSIQEFGFTNPILVDKANRIVAGHGRLAAAQSLGMSHVPVIRLGSHLSDEQIRALILADNKIALNAGWDEELLASELAELQLEEFDLGVIGFADDELKKILEGDPGAPGAQESGGGSDPEKESSGTNADPREGGLGSLAAKFLVPPFSVLDARQGYWKVRKQRWLDMGIKSELGRSTAPGGRALPAASLGSSGTTVRGNGAGGELEDGQSGASIFDPVLAELVVRWFSPKGGTVLDPFAGGSVRGIVASQCERQYVGLDIREEQIASNRDQARGLCIDPMPVWHCGDARDIKKHAKGISADLLFSCPPYGNLERYSDDPMDLSTLDDYVEFRAEYALIIERAAEMLGQNRFACFVVGDFRDRRGLYNCFVWDTVAAFKKAGLHLYNEVVLVTAVGSASLRAGKQFSASRKLAKTHQNVLIFVKGDPRKAAENCGQVEVEIPEEKPEGA